MSSRLVAAVACIAILGVGALLAWPESSYQRFEPDAAYVAQAEAYTIPEFPADWRQRVFETSDGTTLRWGETGNRDSAKATLLIVPGYTATLDMYGEHVDMLARRGYHVVGIDLRGQGLSERHRPDKPEKLWVERFGIYSDDLAEFMQAHLAREESNRLIIPVAMSFGGHVAMRLALDYPDSIDGLFLLAPALDPKFGENKQRAASYMRVAKRLGKSQRYVPGQADWQPVGEDYSQASIELCASNPERLYLRDAIFTRRPEQRVGGVTVQWGLAFLESAEWLARGANYAELTLPVHMIEAELDLFVENDAIAAACGDLPNCTRRRIDGTGHCLMQESDAVLDVMFDDLDAMTASIIADAGAIPTEG